nr:hypothetical protein [Nocardiopsis algeriensis]
MEYSPRVSTALAAVPEDVYTFNADGSLITQTTARERIAATLDGLDLRPGMKVLEIRTGSGYSMHGADLDQWTVPPRGVDARAQDGQGATWWIAGTWAREHPADAESLLARLADGVRTVRVFEDGDDPAEFRAWLYATHPSELVVLGGPQRFGIGVADSAGAFLFRPVGLDALTIGTPAESTARGWVQEWRTAGCPGWAQVRPVLRREGGGWQVRAERSEAAHS